MKRSPLQVVKNKLDVYNRKDIDALTGNYAQDAKQSSLHGQRIAKGREQLRSRFLSWFEEPDLRAQLIARVIVENLSPTQK